MMIMTSVSTTIIVGNPSDRKYAEEEEKKIINHNNAIYTS